MNRFLLIFFLIFISCNKETYYNSLQKKIEKHSKSDLEKYRMIVIIPSSGCTGCITQAENFFVDHYKQQDIKFIFTNLFSYKVLKIKVGVEKIRQKNVFVDSLNLFYLDKFKERIYPFKIEIKENKIIKIERL